MTFSFMHGFLKIAWFALVAAAAPALAQNQHFDLDAFLATANADELRQKLDTEIQKNKGTALALFLEAYLETDAAKAVEKYQVIQRKFPEAREAEYALFKTAQYYFSRGLYVSARKHFLQLLEMYPKSDKVDDAMYFAAVCLYAAGNYQSCYVELTNFLVQNPKSPFRQQAKDDLNEIQNKNGITKPVAVTKKPRGKYALQIGAFSNMDNAERLFSYCATLGIRGEIRDKTDTGNTMYLVWIGSFETEADARTFGEKFKREYGKPFRVVER